MSGKDTQAEEPTTVELLSEALGQDRLDALTELARSAEEADGNPPFSEQTLVELHKPGSPALRIAYAWAPSSSDAESGHLLAGAGIVISGDDETPDVLEMVVRPSCRQRDIGGQLAARLADEALAASPRRLQRAWAHGEHEAARRLAARFGWTPVRELWRMRLSALDEVPSAELPDSVEIRPFRPGKDEETWLRANAAAFSDHPEQGRLTLEDLHARMAEDWFDPSGFLLAWEKGDDGEETLLGFHWTKVHHSEEHEPIGEVYVVGVAPAAQGRGLGRSLTLAGIEHLHRQGLSAIMLYVDADNTPAVKLYKKLGFTRWDVDIQFAPSAE